MRNLVLLFLITLLFFSCTIEKRRYFKGYHVENGRMGKREREEVGKRDPSTGSGTGILRQAEEQEQIAAGETSEKSETSAASAAQKPQGGDIIIESEIALDSAIALASANTMVGEILYAEEKLIAQEKEDSIIQTNHDGNIAAKEIDWAEVGKIFFGIYTIIAFAGSLLFFVIAIFTKDSLTSIFMLLGGGILLLNALLFLAIYAAIKKKQSASDQLIGNLNDPEPNTTAPKPVGNALIPCVILGLLALLVGLKIGGGELRLFEAIEYLLAFVSFTFLAAVLLIITIIRVVRRIKMKRLQNNANPEKAE